MTDISMRILLSATGQNSVISAVQSIGQAVTGGGGLLGILGGVGVAAAGMAIGLGVTAVNAAGDFQNAMDQNVAHAGLAASQVQNVTNALMQMGPAVGQGPTQLATALYPILSSFSGMSDQAAKTQLSLATLNDAAKSVAGTSINVGTVTNAATASFNAYGFATGNAAQDTKTMNNLFDEMNSTVSAGNMRWSDYSNTIGKLSVASHAAGVGFNEENAALATLTNNGYSAQLAGTYLSNTFNDLYIKADNIAKNAKKLGISFDENKYSAMNLGDKIAYLSQVTDGNQSSLLKMLGGNSTALKTFDALSGSINQYKGNLQSLDNSQGATDQAFQKTSEGLNFSWQRLQAAGQALLITVGNRLLPIVTTFLNNAVIPLVTQVTNFFTNTSSLTSNPALLNFFQTVHPALLQLKGAFDGLITAVRPFIAVVVQIGEVLMRAFATMAPYITIIIAQLETGFLRAYTAMYPALTGIAQAILRLVVVIAPVVEAIVKFIAQSGIIPIIFNVIIGVLTVAFNIIATVIIGTIDAITNTILFIQSVPGAVSGAWNAFSSWIQGALSAIGGFFVNIWNGIVNGVQTAWNYILDLIRTAALGILNIITAPFRAIGALFVWLYNHNYYFKALVDTIKQVITDVSNWLRTTWTNIANWLVGAWQSIANFATTLWNTISKAVQTGWNAAVGFVVGIWQQISGVFSSAWNTYIAKPLGDVWNNVSTAVSNAWGSIQQGFSSLWNSISGWFGNLANEAIQWGANIINSIGQGISNSVSNAAGSFQSGLQNAANQIAGFLGFHSPSKLGPGRELMSWGPGLLQGFGDSLKTGIPQLQASLNLAVQPVANTLSGRITPSSSPAAGGRASSPQIIQAGPTFYITISTMAQSQQEVRRLVDMIEAETARRFRVQTPLYASGGIY